MIHRGNVIYTILCK